VLTIEGVVLKLAGEGVEKVIGGRVEVVNEGQVQDGSSDGGLFVVV
jgi:hypothetical protein